MTREFIKEFCEKCDYSVRESFLEDITAYLNVADLYHRSDRAALGRADDDDDDEVPWLNKRMRILVPRRAQCENCDECFGLTDNSFHASYNEMNSLVSTGSWKRANSWIITAGMESILVISHLISDIISTGITSSTDGIGKWRVLLLLCWNWYWSLCARETQGRSWMWIQND